MDSTSSRKPSYRDVLIAAAVATGLGIGTAGAVSDDPSVPQRRSDGLDAAVSDTAITAAVKIKLLNQATLDSSHITVTTTNGVVTLDGSASSARAKAVAEAATKSVDGVKSVDDELRVFARTQATTNTREAVATTERILSDGWITTQVKSEILADSVVKGFEVSVDTMQGVVILKGTLANQDAISAVRHIAEKVDGVKSVDTSALAVSEQ
jgi:hyperosmotically inducible protein